MSRLKLLVVHGSRRFAETFFAGKVDFRVVSTEEDSDRRLVPSEAESPAQWRFEDWSPDIVWVFWPEYNLVPLSLFRLRLPVVAAISDYNLGARAVIPLLPAFDLVFLDRQGVAWANSLGAKAKFARLYSFDPDGVSSADNVRNRPVDVGFLGNLNAHVQRRRAPMLYRLARLAKTGIKVRIATGLYGKPYHEFLSQCKIVFNMSIRGEANLRVFEAPAAGAVMMVESENAAVREILEPNVEYLTYNDQNMEEVILGALSDPVKLLSVARAGQRRVLNELSYGNHFEMILRELEGVRGARRTAEPRVQDVMHQQLWSTTAGRGSVAKRLAESTRFAPETPDTLEAVEAYNLLACTSILGASEGSQAIPANVAAEAERYWLTAVHSAPSFAGAWINLAEWLVRTNRHEDAIRFLDAGLDALATSTSILAPIAPLFFAPFDEFRTHFEGLLSPGVSDLNAEVRRAYSAKMNHMLGDVLRTAGRHRESFFHFRSAAELLKDLVSYQISLARSSLEVGKVAVAEAVVNEWFKKNPGMVGEWAGLADGAKWHGIWSLAEKLSEQLAVWEWASGPLAQPSSAGGHGGHS